VAQDGEILNPDTGKWIKTLSDSSDYYWGRIDIKYYNLEAGAIFTQIQQRYGPFHGC
jgi:hypothetical protein